MTYENFIKNFERKGFKPHIASNKEEAQKIVLDLIDANQTVGFGGSLTLNQLDIAQILNNQGNTLFHIKYNDKPKEEIQFLGKSADWYLSSANGIAETGEIVNIDGRGNRVSAMIHGPKNVLVIAGENKVEETLEKALDRAKNIASPLNAKRFNLSTPCTKTGKCEDCNSPERICNATVIHTNPTFGQNFHIIIVKDSLGF